MIEGFDKEIDALLRRTAKSEFASTKNSPKPQILNPKPDTHLDADEISAFAENALPEKLKHIYTAHFADCDRCRTILANTIALDDNVKVVSVAAPKIAAVSIPWHRKLFAFPQIAYALGALVIVFGGFFAFLVVRESSNSLSPVDVSQTYETQPRANGPNFESEPEPPASSAMSNSMSANSTAANAASNTMMGNAASTSTTANSAASYPTNSLARSSNANASTAQSNPSPERAQPTEVKRGGEQKPRQNQSDAQKAQAAGSTAARLGESENRAADRAQDKETVSAAPPAPRADASALSAQKTLTLDGNESDSAKTRAKKRQTSESESRQLSGKTFTRKEGVWYDASYNGQATTNVSRGSGDYQKLDVGLRSIAGNLNGIVVVVWKNKAYRIQ